MQRDLSGHVATSLFFFLTPYLALLPDQEPFETHFLKPPFSLVLVADGSGKGTEASPLVQGGACEVLAAADESDESTPETAILMVDPSTSFIALHALTAGSDLTFSLIDYDIIPTTVRLQIKLPGDRSFTSLYQRLLRSA